MAFDLDERSAAPVVWVVSDGKAGTENQALGLAEALGTSPAVQRVRLKAPWRWLSPGFRAMISRAWPRRDASAPDLIISAGRSGAAASLSLAAQHSRAIRLHIQNPRIAPRHFDLVIAPQHDRLSGPGVQQTLGSLHRITPERLKAARQHWQQRFEALPQPRIAVLIGGSSRAYRMTRRAAAALGRDLAQLSETTGGSLMVTASRRTPPEATALIREAIAGRGWMWDGSGDNPYTGLLAWAQHIVVTADSVSMASEALATGTALSLYPLPGGSRRLSRFHDGLIEAGRARWFNGALWHGSAAPLDEPALIAARLVPFLRDRGIALCSQIAESW